MARITVEDCLDKVDNRFQLVLIATRRARQLEQGKQSTLALENDKPTVLALREIAAGLVGPAILKEAEAPQEEEEQVEAAPQQEGEEEEQVRSELPPEEDGAQPE